MAQGLAESAKLQLDKFVKNIADTIKQTINAQFMSEIGEEAKRLIFLRTKLGYGVPFTGANREKLKGLSASYIKMRKSSKKLGELSDTTSASKSNLTFTGQLLDSIQVKKSVNGITWIGPRGYRTDGLTNEQVANTVSKQRPFMFLSDLEILKVQRFAQNNFTSVFKQRFK